MSDKVIKIKRGLDIRLEGSAEKVITKAAVSATYAIVPDNFIGVTPKLLVKEGDSVKVGSALFFDKEHPEVLFTSPAAGEVSAIVRGDKRKVLAVVVTAKAESEAEQFDLYDSSWSRERVKELLLKSGYWPMVIQRPFGIIANASETPRAIFVSGIDTAPLGADMGYILQDEAENLSAGLSLLGKLTDGQVHLTISSDTTAGTLAKTKNATIHHIEGPHPAGNVGVQIAAISPLCKGETVWTVNIGHVAMMGRLARTGRADFSKTVALTGSCVKKPHYYKTSIGATISSVIGDNLAPDTKKSDKIRIINGNPLCGSQVTFDRYVGYYNTTISAIAEGDYSEFAGWAMPRLSKFSFSKSYFSALMPKRKYKLDTNLNGGERAFVMNGVYEKVMPMDIYPVYLLKAVIAGDIDKMEQLGIYEVIEEDLALCEFVCPSKIEWQATLRNGISKLIKDL